MANIQNVSLVDRGRVVSGGSSGSGGHTIINESGTSLAQEPNLQFKGADVSDDSTNNRTVVDMSYTDASKCMMSDGETSVEDAINDVESTTLAITGFESVFRLERVGRVCFITYNESVTSLPEGYLTISQTLPERFRPTRQVCVHSDTSSAKVVLFFNSDGTIIGYNYSGVISSRTNCRFGTLSYPALNV